jgi:hypothetical protein
MKKRKPVEETDDIIDYENMTEAQKRQCESAAYQFRERVVGLASDYARYVLAPRILADKRRQAGDPAAKPSDYDCLCELSTKDELPICEERRASCKFSHRKRPPGPRYSDNRVLFRLQRAEEEKILRALDLNDVEGLIAELRRLDRGVVAAIRRIKAESGMTIERNITGWC